VPLTLLLHRTTHATTFGRESSEKLFPCNRYSQQKEFRVYKTKSTKTLNEGDVKSRSLEKKRKIFKIRERDKRDENTRREGGGDRSLGCCALYDVCALTRTTTRCPKNE
jgi:hypothetical protein